MAAAWIPTPEARAGSGPCVLGRRWLVRAWQFSAGALQVSPRGRGRQTDRQRETASGGGGRECKRVWEEQRGRGQWPKEQETSQVDAGQVALSPCKPRRRCGCGDFSAVPWNGVLPPPTRRRLAAAPARGGWGRGVLAGFFAFQRVGDRRRNFCKQVGSRPAFQCGPGPPIQSADARMLLSRPGTAGCGSGYDGGSDHERGAGEQRERDGPCPQGANDGFCASRCSRMGMEARLHLQLIPRHGSELAPP